MSRKFGIFLLAVLLCFAACGDGGKEAEPIKEVTATPVPKETEVPEPTVTPEPTPPEVTEAPEETEVPFVPITATYKVILTELGPEKVTATRLLWELNDKADLRWAKDAIYNPPCVLYETIHQVAAEKVRTDFEATGSTITVEIGMIELEEIQDDPKNYVITLLEVGPYKTTVIDTYRRASGCKLSEAIHAVESVPCAVIEVTNKKDAELIAATFTDHGATVEITELE